MGGEGPAYRRGDLLVATGTRFYTVEPVMDGCWWVAPCPLTPCAHRAMAATKFGVCEALAEHMNAQHPGGGH